MVWCGVVWCGVVFFFGSAVLQHRAREAAHAGEKATSLQCRAPGKGSRDSWTQSRRWPAFMPSAAGKACVWDMARRHSPPSQLAIRCVGSRVRTGAALAWSLAGVAASPPSFSRPGLSPRAIRAIPGGGGPWKSGCYMRSAPLRGACIPTAGIRTRPGAGCATRRILAVSSSALRSDGPPTSRRHRYACLSCSLLRLAAIATFCLVS